MKGFLGEIHRRSLWQVLGMYMAGSWIVLQVVDTLDSTLGLPEWAPQAAFILLLVGLPVVIATTFLQGEKEPEGAALPFSDAAAGGGGARAASAGTSPAGATGVRRLFTPRNAVVAGAGAFTFLGALTAAWLLMRSLGIGPAGTLIAKGVIEEREVLVLADFSGPDTLLNRTITESLRIDLSQSGALEFIGLSAQREALTRMERDPDAPLELEAALELAQREGIKAVIGGSVEQVGSNYILTARVAAAEDGRDLVSVRQTAKDEDDIVKAIDRLSDKVRERAGEPLTEIRASTPLEQATTASLPALTLLSQAERLYARNEFAKVVAALEQAISLDESFALAYRKLGITLGYMGRPREGRAALIRAYEHRDRLTERERLNVATSYYYSVEGDPAKVAREFEMYRERHPDRPLQFHNQVHAYLNLRDFERAEATAQELIEAMPEWFGGYGMLAEAQVAQGRLEAAQAAVQRFTEALPGHPDILRYRALLANMMGDRDRASSILLAAVEDDGYSPRVRALAAADLASLSAIHGMLASADSLYRISYRITGSGSGPAGYVDRALHGGRLLIEVAGDTAAAVERLRSVIDSLESRRAAGVAAIPYPTIGEFFARVGDLDDGRRYLSTYVDAVGGDPRQGYVDMPLYVQLASGSIAMAENRPSDAVEHFEAALAVPAGISCSVDKCALPLLARARDAAGDREGAIRAYERYAESMDLYDLDYDAVYLASVHEQLGRMYDEAGNLEKAAEHYAAFVELWAEADPELQPRVTAARDRLQAIMDARG